MKKWFDRVYQVRETSMNKGITSSPKKSVTRLGNFRTWNTPRHYKTRPLRSAALTLLECTPVFGVFDNWTQISSTFVPQNGSAVLNSCGWRNRNMRFLLQLRRLFLPGTLKNVTCSLNLLLVNFRDESNAIGRLCRLDIPTDGQLSIVPVSKSCHGQTHSWRVCI